MVDLEADNTNGPSSPHQNRRLRCRWFGEVRRLVVSSDNVSTEGEIDLRERDPVNSIVATWSLDLITGSAVRGGLRRISCSINETHSFWQKHRVKVVPKHQAYLGRASRRGKPKDRDEPPPQPHSLGWCPVRRDHISKDCPKKSGAR
jgi:hypothetical protein